MIGNHLTESNVNELAALSGLAYPVGLAKPSIHKVLVTQAQITPSTSSSALYGLACASASCSS